MDRSFVVLVKSQNLPFLELTQRGMNDQLITSQGQALDTLEPYRDEVRIGPGMNDEFGFNPLRCRTIDQVNTFKEVRIRDAALGGNVFAPLGWVIPDKEVATMRQQINAPRLNRIGSRESYAQRNTMSDARVARLGQRE